MMAKRTRSFDISRKIIASMTTDSWKHVPHSCVTYEADAGKLLGVVRDYNSSHSKEEKLSVNTAILKVIIEGIKASPGMNGHVSYDHGFVCGEVTLMDHIDISVPVVYGDGKMMTVNMPHMEDRPMREIQSMMSGYRQRIDNSDMEAVMYLTGLSDTLEGLKHGRVLKAAGRLIGSSIGSGRVNVSVKRMRQSIADGKAGRGLLPEDIKQGSITVSSLGPLYRNWKGSCTLLQVIPPQICAIAVSALQKKPAAENDEIVIKEIIPVTVAFDHRAVDFSDLVPFMERMDELLSDEELITTLL